MKKKILKNILNRIDHLRPKKKPKTVHVWVVEYVDYDRKGNKRWFPSADKLGELMFFETRKEALVGKDLQFHGHEKDLRVSKFERTR